MAGQAFGEMDSRVRGNGKCDTSDEAVGSGRHNPTHWPPICMVIALSILPAHHE